MRRILLGAILVTAAGGAAWMAWLDRHNRLHWDHWDVVKHGVLYRSGQLKLDELVTRTYPLDEINQGYQDMRDGKNIRGVIIYED